MSMMPKRFISTKPFQMPAMVQPSPTATETQSGMRPASCSAASSPEVFLPSIRYGIDGAVAVVPAERLRRLLAQVVGLVVAALDEQHVRLEDAQLRDLALGRVRGDEDVGREAEVGREAGQRRRRVARRRAADGVEAELDRLGRADGARAILEAARRQAAVVLDEQVLDAPARAPARGTPSPASSRSAATAAARRP